MNVYEFVNELLFYYPINKSDEDKKRLTNKYADLLLLEVHKLGRKYEYQQLLDRFMKEYKYKTFPNIADILPFIDSGIVKEVRNYEYNGSVLVIITPDNRIYHFTVTGYGTSLNELKTELKKRYGEVDIRQFPEGTTIMNDRVILPNTDKDGHIIVEELKYFSSSSLEKDAA